MDIVNIYGHILDKSELVIGVGNYNNIHGLCTYSITQSENVLQMQSLPEIASPSVIKLILKYESPLGISDNQIYFSLKVSDSDRYININIESDGDRNLAVACLSKDKAYFWIDYSNIDKTPRSQLLAGSLYSLKTSFGEQDYTISWKIKDHSHGDLIIFLPLSWYEIEPKEPKEPKGPKEPKEASTPPEITCQNKNGLMTLVEGLNQLTFKGFTTRQWCEDAPRVINCTEGSLCGECMGQCLDLNHICYPNLETQSSDKFVCGPPELEPKMNQSSSVTFTATSAPSTTGTTATWIAVIAIVIIIILLTWGLSRKWNI